MPTPQKLPKYLFRGTTIGYPGSDNAQKVPYTCTSSHPVKAFWFALACMHFAPDDAVVYVAQANNLNGISPIYNVLKKIEDEIAFKIAPTDFYSHCDGYIHVADLQRILTEMKIVAHAVARIDNLTRLCRETDHMGVKNIVTLIEGIKPHLKTV